MRDQPVEPGEILAGKYRIGKVLGTGAMGMVVAALHIGLNQQVAIKFMLAGGKKGREQEERFLREARVAAMLRSQHAGKVLDVAMTEGGAPYIVMEFLDGQDLDSLLTARGPLSTQDAVTYILQACEAIAEAHGLGIVHRDIKPANLFLTRGVGGAPCVKVVDFGIAKETDSNLGLTSTGTALGSPLYMCPEAMNGAHDVDARADIWSLGATLYQLLAGVTPFHADTLMALTTRVCLDPPTPINHYRPDVPAQLAAVIVQALEKPRERRWPSVSAFAAALAPYGSAGSAGYAERVASVQQVDVVPSRPTTELPRPPEAAIVAAASPILAGASSVAVATTRPTAQTQPRAGALVVLALGTMLAIAVYFGLRARSTGHGETTISTARTDLSATALVTAATADETAGPTTTGPAGSTAGPIAPPTVAPAGAATATAAPREVSTAHPKAATTAKPGTPFWNGGRR
jgi:serine/threonine-protein kinase